MSASGYTRDFDDVLAAESQRIARHRVRRGMVEQPVLVGLALSGGGIRSASFGLGVLQALVASGLFRMVDYLSTVSGGGYTGTMLTWLLRDGSAVSPLAGGGDGTPVDRLRRQIDYLSPTARLTLRSLLAVVLQHAFFSLSVYGGLLVGFFFLLDVVDQALRPLQSLAAVYADGPWSDWILLNGNALLLASAVCLLVFATLAILPSVFHAVGRWRVGDRAAKEHAYMRRRHAVRRAGAVLQVMLVTFALGTVPLVSQTWERIGIVMGAVVLLALAAMWRRQAGAAASVVAFGVLYGFLLVTHAVAMGILLGSAPWMIWVVVGGALLLGAVTSLDAHGSEWVYRDRLTETFMPDPQSMADPRGRAAREAASYPLASACGPDTAGPYHLLNAALLTTASRATTRRQRGAESFVFSPLYCGSDATGWRDSRDWVRGTTTLACAMATSAAAIDPHTGHGSSRGPLVSLVLALLGLRLGHVPPNPAVPPPRHRPLLPPNLIVPGITQALFGHELESSRYVTIADGGDFDDLGVYELVRRRVDAIIAVDATQDGACTFAALGNVVERVRADFGVEITFDDLAALRPVVASDEATVPTARRAHALGRIRYPERNGHAARDGVIVYLKATMLAGVTADVLAQARQCPEFPHEPTLDQFFDEGKFEAYRKLGWLAADRMLDTPAVALALASPAAYAPLASAVRSLDHSKP